MKTFNSLDSVEIEGNTAVCIGNFDGLHLGHRLIISVLKEEAKLNNLKSLILTFNPHPLKFFGREIALISTPLKRMELFESQNVDYLVNAEFNEQLSSLKPDEFFKNVLIDKLKTKLILVGRDYRFGANKSGDVDYLKFLCYKYGVSCMFAYKLKDENGIEISSSRIRGLIQSGAVDEAHKFLTRPYCLEGEVVHGDKKGRELGFPTINLRCINEVIAENGVYAAKVRIKGKVYDSMAYIGYRPTIDGVRELRVEANIFDFNEDVYGEYAEICLYKYMRGDEKFKSFNDLINQMNIDKMRVRKYLSRIEEYK